MLIVIDTLRGDRLGFSHYPYAVTPNLDSLAAKGIVFANAMTPVPVTLPAITSLLTGRLPFQHGVRDNAYFTLSKDEETLAERFRRKGWRTGAVVGSAVLAADRGLAQGFEFYDDNFEKNYPVYNPIDSTLGNMGARDRRRANMVTDRALEIAHRFGDAPFFLFVHYFDVHQHYDPPPEFAALHPGRPYDGEVSFVDHEIGRLLQGLAHRSDALVVVTADHGESLGQHEEAQHGFLLYESTLYIPLIVVGPGVPSGTVRSDAVSLVDLEPTLAAIFGLPKTKKQPAGRVLTWTRAEKPVPLYAETLRPLISYGWRPLRALRLGDWKLIYGPPTELYNLREDPAELKDLGTQDPAPRLLRILRKMTEGDDPERVNAVAHAGGVDPRRQRILESLGYVGGTTTVRKAGERPHPKDKLGEWNDRQWARRHYRNAAMLFEKGRTRAAMAVLDTAITLDPSLAEAYVLRGDARRQVGNRAGARQDYKMSLSLKPLSGALAALAQMKDEDGDLDGAVALWKRVVGLDADNREALEALRVLYMRRNEFEKANAVLAKLLALIPENANVHYDLALVAYRMGRFDDARRELERFAQLNHDSSGVEAANWLRSKLDKQ